MTSKTVTPVRSLSIRCINNNIAYSEFSNFNKLMSSGDLIKKLATANNFNFTENNGNITVFCFDEIQVYKFIKDLFNKIV